MKSIIVEGLWPVRDFGVPPRGFAEVKISGSSKIFKIFKKEARAGIRIPIVSKWS